MFDTNILISALIARGKPRKLWFKSIEKEFVLVSSRKIRSDFLGVIARKKFEHYVRERDIVDFLKAFNNTVRFVRPSSGIKVVLEDPDDDVILATALAVHADYIVSGDRHLLDIGKFKGTKIVTADEMLKILESTVN